MHQALVLDSQIRDFVFIPLIVMVFFIGILRYAGRDLMMNKGKKDPDPIMITKEMLENDELIDLGEIQSQIEGTEHYNNALTRSGRFRVNCDHLPPDSIKIRKAYF